MMKLKLKLKLLVMLISVASLANTNPVVKAARQVIGRQIGSRANKIQIKQIPKDGKCDVYSYESLNGKLKLEGSSPVAIARGFYDYARANNLGMVGWAGSDLKIPKRWPKTSKVQVTTPFEFNQMYNVVTAGYSFPYWGWKRWGQELDWMALHGYNMLLAPVGTEAISERVWLKLGLTQQEIDDFVCGPSHGPWQRMGNIAKTDGPLPKEWHKDQVQLQHKILKQMKRLDITPVFQGFAGFVPRGMKRLYPKETYHITHWNGGFRDARAPVYVMPDSKLYKKIFRMYIQEFEREFGKGKYYLIDTFNELKKLPTKPGMTHVEVMAEYGKNLSDQLAAVNPDAVWALQGWIFYYQRHLWKPEVVKALLSHVPDDKMLIFDMMGVWKSYSAFYGKPWIYGMITNMGGRTPYAGNFNRYINGPAEVIASSNRGNCVGNSNHSEAIETNEVIFELIADTGWAKKINLDSWLEKFCVNRYGAYTDEIKEVWGALKDTAFKNKGWSAHYGWQSFGGNRGPIFSERFVKAVRKFLSVHKRFAGQKYYVEDAVEMSSFVLGQKADVWTKIAKEFLTNGDTAQYEKSLARAVELLLEADRLLESHSLNRLQRWTDFARAKPGSVALKNYYEQNAKRIVTTWGPPVNDYARRVWSGLIRDFYVPRLKASFERMNGKRINSNQWEEAWLAKPGVSKIKPYSNPAQKAYELVTKACTETLPNLSKHKAGGVIASWSKGQISRNWKTVSWELDPKLLKKMKGLKFVYTKGSSALQIKQVQIIADGNVIATVKHPGRAGTASSRNSYIFKLPKKINTNNGCSFRAIIKVMAELIPMVISRFY